MASKIPISFIFSSLIALMLFISLPTSAQDNLNFPDSIHNKRLKGTIITGSAMYVGSMVGLYYLWYKDYPHSSFHFIDDSKGWLGVDKVGHMATSYYIGRFGYTALRWSGVKETPAIWIGGSMGFIILATVEIFDGFSAEWGASAGDIIANGVGTVFFIGQQFLWHDQRFSLKFSYHFTDYARYNPEHLGESYAQRFFKDYNGHTYWLSANIRSFIRKESKFPKWLNVAVGYGARGMLGAKSNPSEINGETVPHFNRTPQYYLSLDIDLTRIRTKSEFLNILLNLVGFIKIPMPTLEYNKDDQFKFHLLYF
ncbi:MAG: DUF2279 domain-containing protein [Bacteroidota bacterium]|nr:DUF2279 domain-containing protein [Bacteroidota bacterium]